MVPSYYQMVLSIDPEEECGTGAVVARNIVRLVDSLTKYGRNVDVVK
jgi:hypothetical protein